MNKDNSQINMITQQLRTCEVLDEKLLDDLIEFKREDFVPEAYKDLAYAEINIPIGHNQVMMTPFEESSMLQALAIKPTDTILEIGTGTGYVTALLAKLGGHVVSVDYYADFTAKAKEKLAKFKLNNVELLTVDGSRGYVEKAPYDVILFTGSMPYLPKILKPQLMFGGRLFAIVGDSLLMEAILLTRVNENQWQEKKLFETSLAPLLNIRPTPEFIF